MSTESTGIAVALLYETHELGDQLRGPLSAIGAPIVYEAATHALDREALERSHANVVVVSLDAQNDPDLEGVYDLLDDSRYRVVFNDGDVSSTLSGWDHARWLRHLSAKILGDANIDPPRPADAEAVPVPPPSTPVAAAPADAGDAAGAASDGPAPAGAAAAPLDSEPPDALVAVRHPDGDTIESIDLDALLDAANVYPASASRGFAEPERAVEADPEADRLPASAPAAGVAVPHELDAGLIESIDLDALIDAASAYPALPAAGDFDAPLSEAGAGARASQHDEVEQSGSSESEGFDLDLDFDFATAAAHAAEPARAEADADEDFAGEDVAGFDFADEFAQVPDSESGSEPASEAGAEVGVVELPAAAPAAATGSPPIDEWSLEEILDDPAPAPVAAVSPRATDFGIEKLRAEEFLAPDVEANPAQPFHAPSGLSLELIPLDEAVAPMPVEAVQQETWLDPDAMQPKIRKIWVLGASIGGPEAVRAFLAGLPRDIPALFVLAQHLGDEFVEMMMRQLAQATPLTIRAPTHGERVGHGEVIIVPNAQRLRVDPQGVVILERDTAQTAFNPSIDRVLRDVADRFGANAGAIVFSGMTDDAVEGCRYLAAKGGTVYAQHPDTCVVSTMVDGVRESGIVSFLGSPQQLAEKLLAG